MPILRGHDSKGPYYKVYRTKTKYSSEIYIIENVDPPYLKLSDGSSIHYRYIKLTTGETLSKPSVSRKTLAKEKAGISLKNIPNGILITINRLNFLNLKFFYLSW